MEGCCRQLFILKALLNSFAASTGLKVNYSKSMMISINLTEGKLQHLAATFGCTTGSLPFTYLGLPLDVTKTRVEDFLPQVSRCEKVGKHLSLSFSSWMIADHKLSLHFLANLLYEYIPSSCLHKRSSQHIQKTLPMERCR
jgi:hypothetical protein